MEIEIENLSKRQRELADMLWNCDTHDEMQGIVDKYGVQAMIVRDMIIAAVYDKIIVDHDDIEVSKSLLSAIKGGDL